MIKTEFMGLPFTIEKWDSLDGRTVMSWTEDSEAPNTFEIQASKSGVKISGTLSKEISTVEEMSDFGQLMVTAYKEYEKFRPNLLNPNG